jgi:hypothetical protein
VSQFAAEFTGPEQLPEGSMSEEDFSAKIEEIRNVMNLYNRQIEARALLRKIATYFVGAMLAIGIIWFAWHTR